MQWVQGIRDDIWMPWNCVQPFLVGWWIFLSREEKVWLCCIPPLYFCEPAEERQSFNQTSHGPWSDAPTLMNKPAAKCRNVRFWSELSDEKAPFCEQCQKNIWKQSGFIAFWGQSTNRFKQDKIQDLGQLTVIQDCPQFFRRSWRPGWNNKPTLTFGLTRDMNSDFPGWSPEGSTALTHSCACERVSHP